MTLAELETALQEARERQRRTMKALAPKHKGGEGEEFRAASGAMLDAERALASAKGEQYAVEMPFPVSWDTGAPRGTLGFGSRSLGRYSPECDDLFIASNAASASSGRARTTKSSVRFTQRTFPDESIRNSAGREMSAPSRRPCRCTRSHLRITSSCASERIGNV